MNKKLGRLLQPGMGIYFAVMLVFAALAVAAKEYYLAGFELAITVALFVFNQLRSAKRRRELESYILSATNTAESADRGRNPFPMVLTRLGDGNILWANQNFAEVSGFKDRMYEQKITDLIPAFSTDWLAAGKHEYPYDVRLGDRRYRIYGSTIHADDPGATLLGTLYFCDLTELYQVRDEYIRSRPVVGILLVDNYEELTKSLPESTISNLQADINEVITDWAERYHGILRKLEKNRYLLVFEKRDLPATLEDKFSVLDRVRAVTNPAGQGATLSIGLGLEGESFEECYNFASLSIEMALSRGGDQAVVKDRFNFSFYGGHAREAATRSRVRSRITANSLMELIGQSTQVFVMGHKNADLDAIGAAAGVCALCRKKGKKAYIVADLENNAADRLIGEMRQVPEYENTFISAQEALLLCDAKSILVVVDTNRPDQVESKALLESISRVCVIDHHRRAADYIDPVIVNFHETAASSACELVTELIQYAMDSKDVLPIEAKALLSGIFLDTKSFHVRSGDRSFEAAASLLRMGADPVEVKKLLQSDFQNTMAKYQIIKSSRLYRQEIAIAALNTGTTRTLAAQAADELLNISGINASFVLYPDGETTIISARSIGDANVQVILESLGGGGNAATAGAQMKNTTVKDALDRLVASIDKYYES